MPLIDSQTGGWYVRVVVVVVVGAASRSNWTGMTPRLAGKLLLPSALIGARTAVLYAVAPGAVVVVSVYP